MRSPTGFCEVVSTLASSGVPCAKTKPAEANSCRQMHFILFIYLDSLMADRLAVAPPSRQNYDYLLILQSSARRYFFGMTVRPQSGARNLFARDGGRKTTSPETVGRPGISMDSGLGESDEGEIPCPQETNTILGPRREPGGGLSSLQNRPPAADGGRPRARCLSSWNCCAARTWKRRLASIA